MNKILLLLLSFSVFACQQTSEKESANTQLGSLEYAFQISPEAQENFDKGLLLLHSFEYEDAREAFQDALQEDSTEVMALWGETMTHYKALWGLQDVDAGRAVMSRLGANKEERLANIENELEQDFWNGVEILYGEGDLMARNKAYADYMATLYKKHPGNQEVAAFYALGLMWSVDSGRDADVFDLSAKVAASILEENPGHPGALHYLIHANDDPEYAQFSILAANNYDDVAPDAAHALHMPSHIYLALGMWNDMVTSNERSYQASLNRMERKGLDDKARGYHSYAWLHYGYLQQGRFEKAAELLKDMQTFTDKTDGHKGARRYLIDMQAYQRVEESAWNPDFEPIDVDYDGLSLSSKASHHFLNALLAFDKKDPALIRTEIDTLANKTKMAEYIATNDKAVVCSAGPTRYAPSKSDVMRSKVIMKQMEAMIALLEGEDTNAEELMKAATEIEDECEYSSGPPHIPYPSYEQYGDWLLSKERYEEAIAQFDKSLKIAENRAKSLKGKVAALKALGKETEAAEIQKVIDGFWTGDEMS